jgi:hypothetical protein
MLKLEILTEKHTASVVSVHQKVAMKGLVLVLGIVILGS